ncbi:unnamed protein product, partial [Prorocentrum cordatum]
VVAAKTAASRARAVPGGDLGGGPLAAALHGAEAGGPPAVAWRVSEPGVDFGEIGANGEPRMPVRAGRPHEVAATGDGQGVPVMAVDPQLSFKDFEAQRWAQLSPPTPRGPPEPAPASDDGPVAASPREAGGQGAGAAGAGCPLSKRPPGGRLGLAGGRHALRGLAKSFEMVGCHDLASLLCLAGVEGAMRRWQTIVGAHSAPGAKLNYPAAKVYSGTAMLENVVAPDPRLYGAKRFKEKRREGSVHRVGLSLNHVEDGGDDGAGAAELAAAAGGSRGGGGRGAGRAKMNAKARSCMGVHRRLPAFDVPARLGGASRRSRHRHGRGVEVRRRKNETVDALHWCLGARTSACSGASEFEMEAVAALVAPVVAKPATAPSQEEAAGVLLRGHLSYDAEETHATVVPYEFGSVSLPEHVHDAADVTAVLDAEDRLIIEGWQQSMMRFSDELRQLNERIECEPGFVGDPGFGFTLGVGDVGNCFHRLRLPDGMHRCFALRPIPAKYTELRDAVGRGVLIYPCLASFPIGFTWSLWVAQRCSEAVLGRVSQLGPSRRITDHTEPIVLRKGGEVQYALYVDNLDVFGGAEPPVQLALGAGCAALGAVGLKTHEHELMARGGETLGRLLGGRQLEARVAEKRRWRIDGAFRWALRRRRLSGKQQERLVGHAAFVSLLGRTALSVLNACYAFMHRHGDSMAVVWPTVRQELQAFIGLLPLVRAPRDLPWCGPVVATDASLEGWGHCRCALTADAVASVARVPEVPFGEGGLFSARDYFAEGDLISPRRVTGKGKWKVGERIPELEARALVLGLESQIAEGIANSRDLFLVDNAAIVLSFARGRCNIYVVLQQIRRFRALCLIHNIRPYFRWIMSEFNPADAPSRDGGEPGSQRSRCQVEGRGQADRPPGAAQAGSAPTLEWLPPTAGRPRRRAQLRPQAHGLPPAAGPSQAVGRRTLGVAAPKLLCRWPVPKLGGLSVEVAATRPLFAAARAEAGAGQDRGEIAVAAENADSDTLDALTRCEWGRSKYPMGARRAMGQLGALLESEVVQPKTREYYHLLVSRFVYWAKQKRLNLRPPNQLDGALYILKAELFLSGQEASVGERLLAGVLRALLESGKVGQLSLPCAWGGMRGWRRLCPGRSRHPPPLCVWGAVCHWPSERGKRRCAAAILWGLLCYLRPSELPGVKGGHFVPPVGGVSRHWSRLLAPEELGIPTKVGALNDGLQLDTRGPKWPCVVWRELSATPATKRACPFSYQDLLADVQTVSATRGWRLVPYQHRHDKASHDRLRQLRGLPEVMMRGQGRKFKSVARCEKHARVRPEFGQR